MKLARLFKRVFDIDLEYGPHRGGEELKLFKPNMERPDIEKILRHLGLDRYLGPEKPLRRRSPGPGCRVACEAIGLRWSGRIQRLSPCG